MNHHNYGAHGSALIMSIFQPKWFQPQKSLSKSELKIVFELRRPKKRDIQSLYIKIFSSPIPDASMNGSNPKPRFLGAKYYLDWITNTNEVFW